VRKWVSQYRVHYKAVEKGVNFLDKDDGKYDGDQDGAGDEVDDLKLHPSLIGLLKLDGKQYVFVNHRQALSTDEYEPKRE